MRVFYYLKESKMTQESRLVIVIDSRNAARNARNLSDELNSIERNGDFATRSTDRLGVATRQLAGYMAGLITIGTAVSKMDTYTGLQNKLKLVTDSQIALNQAMQDTFKIAQNTGQAWESVSQIYQRFSDNAKRLNLNQAKTAELTDTVAKAIAISGGSASSAEAALIQFSQALASNVLRGEELNSVMEQAPGLAKAIAQGMSITVGQLRSVAAEGKITGDVLVDALGKAKASVDDLFGKTDFTIANSFTQLSNAITKFVGEAGSGSGAAQAISASLSGLAKNLETVTNIAMIGGAYWVGTLIPVMYKSVVASGAKVKALFDEIQATNAAIVQIQRKAQAEFNVAQAEISSARAAVLAAEMEVNANRAVIQSEIQRMQATIAATNAEKAQEAQRLKSQITDQGRAMAITRMATLQQAQALMTAELTALEQRLASTTVATSAAYTSARNAQTAATGRLTAATSGLNVANSLTTRSTFGLLGALGGPVGLGLTVAAVAASYLLLRDNTDKATKSLNENGQTVDEIISKFKELDEVQKRSQIRSETTSLSDLTKKYQDASKDLFKYTINIEKYGYVSAEASEKIGKLALQYENGKITASSLATQINGLSGVSAKAKSKIDEQSVAVNKLKDELQKQKNVTEEMISQSKRKTQSTEAETKATNDMRIAEEKLLAIKKSAASENLKNQFLINTIQRNGSNKNAVDFANFMVNFREANKIPFSETLSAEMLKVAQAQYAIEQQRKKLVDDITDSERERTKELEKQSKLSQRLIGISGNTGIGTGAHLDVRYGDSRDGQKVSKEHLARLQAGGKSLSSYRVSSDYGQRKAPTAGASSFHKGIDFAMPVGTAITTSVAVKDVKTAYDAKGGGYYSTVTFEDGVVLKLLHQAPSVMSKVKGGPSDGTYKSNLDLQKQAEEVARNQIQLQMAVADEITRIRQNLADDLKEIDKAGYSDDEAKKLKAQYQVQANNDIAIAQQAIRTKLDDYKAFTKTEEQLLRDSFARRQFEALHDLELTKSQRQEAVKFLAQQEQKELALIKLSQEQRLYQSRLFLMSETEAMRERYRIEREEIDKTTQDEEEKRKRLALSRQQEQLDLLNKAAQASKNWSSTYAEMMSNSQMFQLDQTRKDRTGQSLAIADSQNADVMSRAQDPNADMEALAAEQEAIWQAHRDRMALIDQDYWSKTKAYQLGMAADVFGGLSGVMLNFVDESSSSYRALVAIQKGANLASVLMNSITAITAAWASAPFPGNLPAVAMATMETGALQATLQAFTPQGFATGGLIRGPGTGTSDSIPIMASNKEFMFKASSVASIGLDNLNYMNRTGELPQNHDATQLSAIQRQQRQSDLINTSINQRNAGVAQTAAPTIVDNQMVVNNVFNPKDIPDAMANPYGAKVFMNFIKLHKSTIRGMLGVT